MDFLQFITGMTGNVMNYEAQQDQLMYQKHLNNWQESNYNMRNYAFRDALMHSSLGISDLGSAAYGYVNNKGVSNYSYDDFVRDNPFLADSPNSHAMYEDAVKKMSPNAFDMNDFITLYNIGQNDITRQREDTAISRAVKDFENAGLNPLLFGGNGASSSSYQTSGGSNPRPSGLNAGSYTPFNWAVSAGNIADTMVKFAQAENINANTELIEHQKEKIDSETTLNGSLLDLNAAQRRLYIQQTHDLATKLPLNLIQKDILFQQLGGLQWNLNLAKKYGVPVNQQIPIAIAGIDHIVGSVSNESAGSYVATGLFALATILPVFKLGSLGAKALINFGKSTFGYKRVDNMLDNMYDFYNDGKSYFKKYFDR